MKTQEILTVNIRTLEALTSSKVYLVSLKCHGQPGVSATIRFVLVVGTVQDPEPGFAMAKRKYAVYFFLNLYVWIATGVVCFICFWILQNSHIFKNVSLHLI